MKRLICVMVFIVCLFTFGSCSMEVTALGTGGVLVSIFNAINHFIQLCILFVYHIVAIIINTLVGFFLSLITSIDAFLGAILEFISNT